MLLPMFSHRMDIRCFLSGLSRARRCAVLNCYKSLPKIRRDFLHPVFLCHMERAAPVTVAAARAVGSMPAKFRIMAGSHMIANSGQVIIFVNQADIQTRRTWMAVAAVNTASCCVFRCKCTQNRVVPLLGRSIQPGQGLLHILQITYSRQNRYHTGLIQGILETLDLAQGLAKRRSAPVKHLPTGIRLHNGNSNSLRLAATV